MQQSGVPSSPSSNENWVSRVTCRQELKNGHDCRTQSYNNRNEVNTGFSFVAFLGLLTPAGPSWHTAHGASMHHARKYALATSDQANVLL